MEFTALVPELVGMGQRIDLANLHSPFLKPSLISTTNIESDIDKSKLPCSRASISQIGSLHPSAVPASAAHR